MVERNFGLFWLGKYRIVMVERNFGLFWLGKCCVVISGHHFISIVNSGRNFGLFGLRKYWIWISGHYLALFRLVFLGFLEQTTFQYFAYSSLRSQPKIDIRPWIDSPWQGLQLWFSWKFCISGHHRTKFCLFD
jgi:hypothetical protein